LYCVHLPIGTLAVMGGPIFRGWHLGTVPRAPRPEGAPHYSGGRRNRCWVDRSI